MDSLYQLCCSCLDMRERLLLEGGTKVRVGRRFAEGGFSYVYLATDERSGQTRALKRMQLQSREQRKGDDEITPPKQQHCWAFVEMRGVCVRARACRACMRASVGRQAGGRASRRLGVRSYTST